MSEPTDPKTWATGDPNVSIHVVPQFEIGKRPVDLPEEPGVLWKVLPGAGQLADGITTVEGIRRGYREGNPVMATITGNPTVFLAAKLAAGVVMGVMVNKLGKKNPRAAKGISVAMAMLGFAPAALNISTMREGR